MRNTIGHSELAQIAVSRLGIPVSGGLRDFFDEFMAAGTCEPDSDKLKWVNGITGSMNGSNIDDFNLAVNIGVEII